jgi:glutamyl-tRNA reductase
VSLYAEPDTDLLLGADKLVAVGYTHRTAPLGVRSRFAVVQEDLPVMARRFRGLPGVAGCAVLGTCNRLEAYLEIRSIAEAEAAFVELVGGQDLAGRTALARCLMVRGGAAAVRHLFRVASGLDAMVLGDAQILGQVKQAYRTACQHGTAGPLLHKAFHAAFRCAKIVRSQTDLGAGAQSVAGSAVALLAERCDRLQGSSVLLVGVNDMTKAAGERLRKLGVGRLLLCNRTMEHGNKLAGALSAELVPWSDLLSAVAEADAIVTCTGAAEAILTRADLAAAAAARPDRLLAVADIAVPPDVERLSEETRGLAIQPRESEQGRLIVFDLEDIAAHQQSVEDRRCQAAAAGEAVVAAQVAAFHAGIRNQILGPKMERLREEAEETLTRELARLPADLSEAEHARLTAFGRTLIKRFLGASRRIEDEI